MEPHDAIITIIGKHAGEEPGDILRKKQKQIHRLGKAFWVIHSQIASTIQIQRFGERVKQNKNAVLVYFINPSQEGGARETDHKEEANYYSRNGINKWISIPGAIKPTGMINKQCTGLVLKKIDLCESKEIDLWKWSIFSTLAPIHFRLGASTVCAIRKPSNGMRSHYRQVVAIGTLTPPFGVFLQK